MKIPTQSVKIINHQDLSVMSNGPSVRMVKGPRRYMLFNKKLGRLLTLFLIMVADTYVV